MNNWNPDQLIKEALSDMKVPVNTNWAEMDKLLTNIPQEAQIGFSKKSFLDKMWSKVVAGITIAGIITSVILITPFKRSTNNNNIILKPKEFKHIVLQSRSIQKTDSLTASKEHYETPKTVNQTGKLKPTTPKETVVINVEKTVRDTIE